MIRVIEQKADVPKIAFAAKNSMLFFNCAQETIDKAVEDGNRRRAYLGVGDWGDEEGGARWETE